MDLDTNSVVNLPGTDDRTMDKVIALRAACQITGAPNEANQVDQMCHEFTRWLKDSHGDSDKLVRRYVLLVATHGRSGISDREVGSLVKLIDDLYRRT